MNEETENDEVDFSVINPHTNNQNRLDFSLQSLLGEPDRQKALLLHQDSQEIKQKLQKSGSFMKDLQKMEKSVSYQSEPYNIFETSECPNSFTHTIEAKQESTETKTINNSKRTFKFLEGQTEPDINYLIVDFKEENQQIKFKPNYQEYFSLKVSSERDSASHLCKDKNMSVIRLSPKNLKIKSKSKKSKRKSHSKGSTSSLFKGSKRKLKTESNENTKKKHPKLKEGKKQNSKRETVCEEYYGYNTQRTDRRKQKGRKSNSIQKTRTIIISRKNIKINN